MLFVQSIILQYGTETRFPSYANERRKIRFFPVKYGSIPDNAEVLVDSHRVYQSVVKLHFGSADTHTLGKEIFEANNWYNLPVDNVVKVIRNDDGYELIYRSYDKKLFCLKKGQYGRVMYNYRRVYRETRRWIYTVCILNYLNEDRNKFREKIFFRKTPDFEFNDMKILH